MKTKIVAAMVVLQALVCSLPDLSRAGDIPAESVRLHARLSGRIQPSVRSWIRLEANKFRGQPAVDESRLRADIAARFKGQNLVPNGIEEVAFLVMMQATQDADSDLKDIAEKTRVMNESRRKLREKTAQQKSVQGTAGQGPSAAEKGGPAAPVKAGAAPDNTGGNRDSTNEMSDMNSIRMQMAMERRSKCVEMLSNIMKKMSTTAESIVGNLK